MIRCHRIALDPNNKQTTFFARACGSARFAYNWSLAEWKRQYANGGKPNEAALRRQLNAIKKQDFPWMSDVGKVAVQQAVKDLGTAYKNFFEDLAKYKRGEIKRKVIRRPKFKKKSVRDSFRADNGPTEKGVDAVQVQDRRVKLPKVGWIRMLEPLRFQGQVKSATVSKTGGRWFVSLAVETKDIPTKSENQAAVGVDLGVSSLATLSTGEVVPGPKPHKALLARLQRLGRSLSRKKKGSGKWQEAKRRIGRLCARIGAVRTDALHKLTTEVAGRFDLIGIEDLNVKGMAANRHLARSILDMGFFEFRRQLEYKAAMRGGRVVVADRWFASSKTCSACGWKNEELKLSDRSWTCLVCCKVHDRDVNAAKNLENYARTASSAGSEARGEGRSGRGRKAAVKLPPVKREPNVKASYGQL